MPPASFTPAPAPAPSVSAASMGAAARGAAGLMAGPPLKKLVFAIHGIGDQHLYSTAQTVAARFGAHFDFPAAAPLGKFHTPAGSLNAYRFTFPPQPHADLEGIGIMEIYWADIPRRIHKRGYIIEESKAWARTIVQRVRSRYGEALKNDPKIKARPGDYSRAADVLDEMIETLHILGRLVHLAEKAGIMKFDLEDLLTKFLGDVQIVADFPRYRERILHHFRSIIDSAWDLIRQQYGPDPEFEIYFVAHSEGTVIAFLGLLQAIFPPAGAFRPPWVDHVRGIMTIGSPLDKHIILWPEMWEHTVFPPAPPPQPPAPAQARPRPPIHWKNYYDFGDPVGFNLNTTRDWMDENGWSPWFRFDEKQDDHGFTRYLLPGAAHNEYWGDKKVFGHFIQEVMKLDAPDPRDQVKYKKPPATLWYARIGSYVIPYLLAFGLLYGGVYVLFNVLRDYVPPHNPDVVELVKKVSSISFLITGMTLAVRIPRLTRVPGWRFAAWLMFAGCIALYFLLVPEL